MIKALLALTRLDKPVGIYLLWFPCAWALWLAYPQTPPLGILTYFAMGTLVMRSAGCVINDIADRRWDGYVARTKTRPLANQEISLVSAWLTLTTLLLAALLILSKLPQHCIYAALPSAFLSIIYPFCKRFLKTPQLILGLAFSMSIPMVAIASHTTWTLAWSSLWLLTILWVVAYDTQYALADIDDDRKLGILSSAIFFKEHVYLAILCLQSSVLLLWLYLSWQMGYSLRFYGMSFLGSFLWLMQAKLIHKHPLAAFKQNTYYGLWMWFALILEKF